MVSPTRPPPPPKPPLVKISRPMSSWNDPVQITSRSTIVGTRLEAIRPYLVLAGNDSHPNGVEGECWQQETMYDLDTEEAINWYLVLDMREDPHAYKLLRDKEVLFQSSSFESIQNRMYSDITDVSLKRRIAANLPIKRQSLPEAYGEW